jgi:ribosomal protein L40E/bacterioferritin (cytochrome b1)
VLVDANSAGGASDEAGGEYRRGVAALFAAYGLNGLPFPDLPFPSPAVVQRVALETDDPVDDVVVSFNAGRLFIQAKRSLGLNRPLREAVEQWIRAVDDPGFDETRDYVAVASGSLTGTADALRQALVQLRAGRTELTIRQRKSLDALRTMLRNAGASATLQDRVVRRALILRLQVEEQGDHDAARGALLLDGHVVEKGTGSVAWTALVAIAGRAARLRIGHSIEGWLDELRKRELELTADAEASRAAYLEARERALGAYRNRIIELGEKVDLLGLGAIVPPIPFADIDVGLEVFDPAESDRSKRPLLWQLRRRGRVLLTGLPGGGKTVALRSTAAAWASRADWTTPIVVSLRPLADSHATRDRPLRERILDVAVSDLATTDRALARDALDHALERGEAILFLDGLDEAADRRLDLTGEIANLIAGVHPDTDVVLATRDVGYAGAHALLRFADLRLAAPNNASRATTAVLNAVAEARGVNQREAWIKGREEWVERALRRDHQLSETPLIPILLALVAADSETEELPETRAAILSRVVQDIVARHEIKRGSSLSALGAGQERAVLIEAFPLIARVVSEQGGTAPRTAIAEVLAVHLGQRWGLAPGPAEITAQEILVFWDESGVFVAQGQKQLTSPRLRLLLEIGAAMDAADRPDDAETFVRGAAADETRRETVVLAAGLSPEIADALIAMAVESTDVDLAFAAADAVDQGAQVSNERITQLANRILQDVRSPDRKSWRAATKALSLPLDEETEDVVIAALAVFPQEHELVGQALAALNRGVHGDHADALLEKVLRLGTLPELDRPERPAEFESARHVLNLDLLGPDSTVVAVREQAAERLLPTRPDLAPVIAAGLGQGTVGSTDVLAALLERYGHGDLASSALAELYQGIRANTDFLTRLGDMDAETRGFVSIIASLGEPTPLRPVDERRLPTLAMFLEAVNYNHSGRWPMKPDVIALREAWCRLVAQLGDLDLEQLAAEATVLSAEIEVEDDFDPLFSLIGVADSDRTQWSRVDDRDAGAALAVRMLGASHGTAVVAAEALAAHPKREETGALVRVRFPQLPLDRKRPAVWAYLRLSNAIDETTAELVGSDDAAVRAAVAALIDWFPDGKPRELAAVLARDSVRQVQLPLLEQLASHDAPRPALVSFVEGIADLESTPFICFHCGATNTPDASSCASCNVVTERPQVKARALLAEWSRAARR